MRVRYTFAEKAERARAQAIIDQLDTDWPDLSRAQHHKARAKGVIARIEEQARKRAEERVKRNKLSRRLQPLEVPPAPLGMTKEKWAEERQRAEEFMAKVRAVPEGQTVARSAEPGAVTVKIKPQVVEPPIEVPPAFVICEKCMISTEYCGCTGTKRPRWRIRTACWRIRPVPNVS